MEVSLSSELADLLTSFAKAYREPVQYQAGNPQKQSLHFYTAMGTGTSVEHPNLPQGELPVAVEDLWELDSHGLIDIRYGRGDHDGSFRVTSGGFEAVDQITKVRAAMNAAPVTPEEGKRMGLDWPTDVLPVLVAAFDLYTRTGNAVRRPAITHELGREPDDEHTGLVLEKLEEGGWISSIGGADQVRGPLICEPTTKTLELVANWPTDRGDMALGRLISVLEERIEATDDPAEKKKLSGLLDSVKDVSESVMAGVLTKMITGASGLG
jgi:hypothetical protein